MAVHREPAEESADPLGPRWGTVVPYETSVPDIDPGAAFLLVDRDPIDWRIEARDEFSKIVADHLRAQADREFLAEQTARFETGRSREADQFQAWLEYALRKGNLETQLALIAEVPYPPDWLKRYTAYARQHQDRTAERLAWFEASPRAVDTGTFFYQIPEGR